jgi:hypothetical protein
MKPMFGPNGQQVLALIASIPSMSAEQVDEVASAWQQSSPHDRDRAWAHLSSICGEDERYGILAAASLARREALAAARRVHRTDWAFWAAACDAGAALAAGDRIGRHYETLVAPFAQVVPAVGRSAPSDDTDEDHGSRADGAGHDRDRLFHRMGLRFDNRHPADKPLNVDAVGQLEDAGHVVADQHDRQALLLQPRDEGGRLA